MERIGVAGLSIHKTDVDGLAAVRRPDREALGRFLLSVNDELGASELVFLATCNRVEVIFAREEGDPPGAADVALLARVLGTGPEQSALLSRSLELRTGRDAVRHLFRVASSLDSLMIGEDQILAQVREAYGAARDRGLVGTLLGPLFHHALQIGKQVRSRTELARHPVSVVNLAVATLLEQPDHERLTVAVVGAGEMGALLARALGGAGQPPAVIVNRSLERARPVAADCGALAMELGAFAAGAAPVDVIVSATSAPGLVFSAEQLRALSARAPAGRGLLGIDLAVPRDLPPVEPGDEAGDCGASLRVVDLDALRSIAERNRARRAEAAAVAEQLVDQKLEVFARRFHEDRAAPVVTELRQASEELLDKELGGLLGGRLAHLPEPDRRAVERWARATFGRLMHLPVTAIKKMVVEADDEDPADEELP